MTTGLDKYNIYKPSETSPAIKVPAHWEICALKRLAKFSSGAGFPIQHQGDQKAELPFLKVSDMNLLGNERAMIVYNNSVSRSVAHALGATIFPPGIIIFPKVGGALLTNKRRVTTQNCCLDNNLMACTVRHGSPDFVRLLLDSIDLSKITNPGPVPAINESQVGNIRVHLPPLDEQHTIVRYLDHADELISRYISAKERLITLLEEQRQAVIHQAVTRGLDSDVQTKPGEIPWLENIPKHWDVRRLGQLATKFGSGVTPRGGAAVYRDNGVPFLRSQNVHFDGLRLDDVVRIPLNLHESMSASHVQPHDVLLNITGASIGRVCSVPYDLGQGNVNQHVCIIRPNQQRLLSRFLVAFLSTSGAQNDIRTEQTGASREGLTLQSIRDFRIPLPSISEQTQIVHRIDEATHDVYRAIASTSRQIDLTNEYRTRLIADVVTGQIDVRDTVVELLGQHL